MIVLAGDFKSRSVLSILNEYLGDDGSWKPARGGIGFAPKLTPAVIALLTEAQGNEPTPEASAGNDVGAYAR